MKYKHILWDWNGTLLDDTELCLSILNGMLGRQGLPSVTMSQYREIFRFPVRKYYEDVGLDLSNGAFEVLADEFIEEYNRRVYDCELHPGVQEIISTLADSGKKQSVLSAAKQSALEEALNYYRLAPSFFRIRGIDNHYAGGKVEAGKALLSNLSEESTAVIMFGDTAHDFEVANELGIDCILIADGHQSEARLKKCGVPVIDSLAEVTRFV